MACYSPLQAVQSFKKKANGKYQIFFGNNDTHLGTPIELPCGQCVGCRLERSRQWAVRCLHEASLHKQNCFITLTYNQENHPKSGSIDVREFQLFMKSFRNMVYKNYLEELKVNPDAIHNKLRYFHCGEYGDQFGRPYYHACIFNYDFPDKVLIDDTEGKCRYTSKILDNLWNKGTTEIGEVTFASAAYVARYIMKKVNGEQAEDHYNQIDKKTGELQSYKNPEYITMSRRPGIGKDWLEKYLTDVYPHDHVIINGKETKPPKFYDSQYELQNSEGMQLLKKNECKMLCDMPVTTLTSA